jgi:hypothetical protein
MHLGAMTTKGFAIAAAITALTFFALGLIAAQAGASTGGVGTGGASASTTTATPSSPTSDRVGPKFDHIWDSFTPSDKRWAHSTSQCESGGDPDAIGGGGIYRGAFQFMRSTWKASPKSPGGDPIAFPYRTQAVVAVLLMHRDGAGHWPVCG